VDSVQARVLNLKDIVPTLNHQVLSQAIIHSFLKAYHQPLDTTVELLQVKTLSQIPSLQKYYNHLNDWEWRFGKTPNFQFNVETRFPWGIIDIHIQANKGTIEAVKIYSDSLVPQLIESLMRHLVGVKYSREGIKLACSKVKQEPFCVEDQNLLGHVTQFEEWLTSQL